MRVSSSATNTLLDGLPQLTAYKDQISPFVKMAERRMYTIIPRESVLSASSRTKSSSDWNYLYELGSHVIKCKKEEELETCKKKSKPLPSISLRPHCVNLSTLLGLSWAQISDKPDHIPYGNLVFTLTNLSICQQDPNPSLLQPDSNQLETNLF